jgi:anti-sigma factor RsiW
VAAGRNLAGRKSTGERIQIMIRPSASSCVDQATLLMLEDGALAPGDEAAVRAHLIQCRRCEALADELHGWRRTALAFAGADSATAEARKSCPDAAELGAYTEGTLTPEARQVMTLHLAGCGACTADLAALATELAEVEAIELEEAVEPMPAVERASVERARAPHAAAPSTATAGGGWFGSWLDRVDRLMAGWRHEAFPAAAAIAVALIVLVQIPELNPQAPAERRAEVAPSGPRIVLAAPVDGGVMGGRLLSWERLPGAGTYKVTVVDDTGDLVWVGETMHHWIEFPPSVPLIPGNRYAWWVTSVLESGERARSSVQRFTFEP